MDAAEHPSQPRAVCPACHWRSRGGRHRLAHTRLPESSDGLRGEGWDVPGPAPQHDHTAAARPDPEAATARPLGFREHKLGAGDHEGTLGTCQLLWKFSLLVRAFDIGT